MGRPQCAWAANFLQKQLWVVGAAFLLSACLSAASQRMGLQKLEGKIRITCGGSLFADYVYRGYAKPIIYPVLGPYGIPMTRNWPMKEVPGEARDHRHHKSLWYTHGNVNGVDFWAEGSGKGIIEQAELLKAECDGTEAVIVTKNAWKKPDGDLVCTDIRRVCFRTCPEGRIIDFDITVVASEGRVVFGDTKEGTMAIRTHPSLRLRNDPRRGVTTANGHAVNSEGVTGRAVWGKRAKWVDYWGTIHGKVVGIAIFDHPSNPRHPTWWHARDYGLIAANPFGIHNFEGKPRGTGDLEIPAGEKRRWRYRFVFHRSDTKQAAVPELYKRYAGGGGGGSGTK